MSSSAASVASSLASVAPTPSFSVQCDWEVVLREFTGARATSGGVERLPVESKQFWVNLAGLPEDATLEEIAKLEPAAANAATAPTGTNSLAAAARSVRAVIAEDAFEVAFRGPLQLQAFHAASNTTQLIQAPRSTMTQLHPSGDIFTVDVNAAGTTAISGGEGGSLRTWDAVSGTLSKDLRGHVGDIRLARFFPSGVVALSTGLDLVIRIWAIDSGLEATRLAGHARPVTAVRFLERGRHLVTAAEDGTAKLWDVSSQTAIATYPNRAETFASKINDAILFDSTAHPFLLAATQNQLPDAANGHLLLTGGADGIVRGYDLRAQTQVLMIPTGARGGIDSLAVGPTPHTFTFGGGEGEIAVVDLRKKQSLCALRQDDAAITDIRPWTEDSFWTTNSTGAANLWRLDGASGSIVAQLSGVDCEPIHDICITSNFTYLASHGAVRSYALAALNQKAEEETFHGLQIPQRKVQPTPTPTPATPAPAPSQ